MFRLRWVSCYPLLLQMVSVAWLFVFSKFIELTDTVSELLGRPCAGGRLGLCWMGTWSRCFLQPFPSGLPVVSLLGRSLDYGRSHLQGELGDEAALNAWCSLL